ncbi:MAG: hypothetical protein C6H99_05395 [Epsilonproteobacteria bacterium]|nr:hypothetical protein [Campylobacterota bacterium]NPA64193.1 class I SAM-dependent methyltransferase [Campylobacterota bacterium]
MNKWDKKYLHASLPEVNEHLKRFYHLAKRGKALDIACGMGQNAKFLASKGFEVECVDISKIALSKAKSRGVTTFCCNIEEFLFGEYDLIVCFNFLLRSIHPKIIKSLKPQGILIYETFTYHSKINPQYRLAKNELLQEFLELEILHYELFKTKALLVAQKS